MAALGKRLGFDSLALAVVGPGGPAPESVLLASGVAAADLQQWCDRLAGAGRGRAGVATSAGKGSRSAVDDELPLPAGQQVTVHTLRTGLAGRRMWYLALGRAQGDYSTDEQLEATLWLTLLRASFDHVDEPGLGRVLLDHDLGLLHADPGSEARFIREPGTLRELAEALPPVVAQRWPELQDATVHDLALVLGGEPTWVRLRRCRPLPELDRHHWYLELRPLSEQDIPPLGVIEDERVARAVAYLSDRYDQSPTLNEVAEAVSTSPFHFHRLFVRHVGLSPKHYLLRMQIMIAKWLLRATRVSVGDVAAATGFASHGHFTATFHRLTGTSPSAFREQQ